MTRLSSDRPEILVHHRTLAGMVGIDVHARSSELVAVRIEGSADAPRDHGAHHVGEDVKPSTCLCPPNGWRIWKPAR